MSTGHQTAGADYDVIVIGAGFAGLYGLYEFRAKGYRTLCIEAAADVGGVWYFNAYPGARCDVESIDYSYSFSPELQREWRWSERYASQPEILAYLRHVAERFELRPDICFSTRVLGAARNEAHGIWRVVTDTGKEFATRHLVLATGVLSTPKPPAIEGLETFAGEWYQTSLWPHRQVAFQGKRVGLIGTGSSGIQAGPVIAETAKQLFVFQRTAGYTIPANNGPIDEPHYAAIRARYPDYRRQTRDTRIGAPLQTTGRPGTEFSREERRRLWLERWQAGGAGLTATFTDTTQNRNVNEECADFVRDQIRAIVKDARTADLLCPFDHPIGSRRICIDSGYYQMFNRPNVTLVDVRNDPITRIGSTSLYTQRAEYPLEMIIFAIGFDAVTGAALSMEISNGRGQCLTQAWAGGPKTYLGLMTAGFPNLYMVTGPGSPSVFVNMVAAVEHDIRWISQCIDMLGERGRSSIEARPDAQEDWTRHVAEVGEKTILTKASSWYVGANVPGKPRVLLAYPAGFNVYTRKVAAIVADDYRGFDIR